jgi:hypothetical protein
MKTLRGYIQWVITGIYFGIFYVLGQMDLSQRHFELFMVLLLTISFILVFLVAKTNRREDA